MGIRLCQTKSERAKINKRQSTWAWAVDGGHSGVDDTDFWDLRQDGSCAGPDATATEHGRVEQQV